jgi:hypothetical protein
MLNVVGGGIFLAISLSPAPIPAPAPCAPLSFTIQLTAADLFRSEMSIIWRKARPHLLFWTAVIFLLSCLYRSALLMVSFLFFQSLYLGLMAGFSYLGARSTLHTNKALKGPIHYGLDNNSVSMRAETFWGHTDWCNIYEVIETRHSVLIRPSSMQKYVLPKRFFKPEDLQRLRALVQLHVHGSVKLLRRDV